jgi:hypothetical protein
MTSMKVASEILMNDVELRKFLDYHEEIEKPKPAKPVTKKEPSSQSLEKPQENKIRSSDSRDNEENGNNEEISEQQQRMIDEIKHMDI